MLHPVQAKEGETLINLDELCNRWQETEAAIISKLAGTRCTLRLEAQAEDGTNAALILRSVPGSKERPDGRTNLAWKTSGAWGGAAQYKNTRVTVTGTPTEETPAYNNGRMGRIQPWPDRLFLGGLVELSPLNATSTRITPIGRLVALSVQAGKLPVHIWQA